MIAAQCRAGRGLLNMTVKELAARARVATHTIVSFENEITLHQRTGIAIRSALASRSARCSKTPASSSRRRLLDENGGGPGVRLRKAMLK
jgi:DNA-binding XRE family transcriptional regulator